MKNEFMNCIKNTILRNGLLSPKDFVLAAVSGGADSVCLLHVLCALKDEWNLTLSVAHLNHMLRGSEADRDEEFVRSLCARLNIPFYCERVDVAHMANCNKMTCEEAGRKARYDFFLRLKTKYSIDKIATAHNKNDNAETVCMRFLRGTGIDGLAGIPIKNNFSVIRPLLNTSRQDIETYLKENGISFITDSSNLSDDYLRNRIRHHFLPDVIRNYNKNFVETLSENILLYREASHFFKKQADSAFLKLANRQSYGIYFDLPSLLQEDSYVVKCLIRTAISEQTKVEASCKTVRLIYENVVLGNCTSLSVNALLTVYKLYDRLYFVTANAKMQFYYESKGLEKIIISETGKKLIFSEGSGDFAYEKNVIYIKKSMCKDICFTVRNRLPGDSISLGFGHKTIKKLLIDEKVPSFLRDEIPILLLGDEIVWVCGIRDNPAYRAVPGDAYIKISYLKEKNHE